MKGQAVSVQSGRVAHAAGSTQKRAMRLSPLTAITLLVLIVAVFYGVRMFVLQPELPVELVVYAFSTQEEALTHSVLPAFERQWEAETGRALTINSVFGPSATLAGQIVLGAPADVALFSNAHHVTYLRVGKRISEQTAPQVYGYTPMVIVVRPENPLQIADYRDLARPNVRLIHASPNSSGGGEWAVLAEYGSLLLASGDAQASAAQLDAIWRNVCLLAPSARSALTLFELGAGDALVTYEQDALLARERGVALEIVVPPRTIVAEPVVVIVDDNVTRAERAAAEAFVAFLLSDEAQDQFARYHQRPVNGSNDGFVALVDPVTVEALGGWPRAYHEVVEALWQRDIEPRLDAESAPRLLPPDPAGTDEGGEP